MNQYDKPIYSGERIVPGQAPDFFFQEHLARYEFVRQFLKADFVLLDAGCGEGYGSALLAELVSHVDGIDVSKETVDLASKKYVKQNLAFKVMDARKLDFASGYFDFCTSFEVFEHIKDVEAYLGEIRRVLKPGGIFAVSTPNRLKYVMVGLNPYHVKEYSLEEFEEKLRGFFRIQEIYAQSCTSNARKLYYSFPIKIIWWIKKALRIKSLFPQSFKAFVEKTLTGRAIDEVGTGDFKFFKGDLTEAEYFIAIVKKD